MAMKQMLYALTKVNQWLETPAGKAAKLPEPVAQAVRDALVAGAATLLATGRPKKQSGGAARAGRPPSTFYSIDVSNYEPYTVGGGQAAAAEINAHMERLGAKRRFTANNITVSISRNGEWWHNVDTDGGVVTLVVRRVESA